MKLIVLTKGEKTRLLVNILEEPDYRSKYLQEDGSPFPEEVQAASVATPKPVKATKAKKPLKKVRKSTS